MTPAVRAEVVQVATAEVTVTAEQPDIEVPPDLKLTVPAPPDPIVAVSVTDLPTVDCVSGETVSVVVVVVPDTTGIRGDERGLVPIAFVASIET